MSGRGVPYQGGQSTFLCPGEEGLQGKARVLVSLWGFPEHLCHSLSQLCAEQTHRHSESSGAALPIRPLCVATLVYGRGGGSRWVP